jgi:protein-S-isoprenylcysteine O-methyltransferase Ste14
MNPWFAKTLILAASIAMVVIRAPHGQRSRTVPVVRNRKGTIEKILLTIAWIAFFLPLIWIVTPVFSFADYPLHPIPFAAGTACLVLGLWLFHRSHKDLGANWSISLELRENHRLVTEGIYRRIRHPMYLGFLVYSAGQSLALPNWFVGPSYLAAMVLLIALRLGPEERMMREEFGSDYETYQQATWRLLPGVW